MIGIEQSELASSQEDEESVIEGGGVGGDGVAVIAMGEKGRVSKHKIFSLTQQTYSRLQ